MNQQQHENLYCSPLLPHLGQRAFPLILSRNQYLLSLFQAITNLHRRQYEIDNTTKNQDNARTNMTISPINSQPFEISKVLGSPIFSIPNRIIPVTPNAIIINLSPNAKSRSNKDIKITLPSSSFQHKFPSLNHFKVLQTRKESS